MSSDKTGTPAKKPKGVSRIIRNRIMAGLFVALPLFITFLVMDWAYRILLNTIIGPIARWLLRIWYPPADPGETVPQTLPFWIEYVLAPVSAVALVFGLLFIAGMFFRSRLHRMLDWILLNVPGVNVVYSAVKNVVDAIGSTQTDHEEEKFKRVVLIEFPHPGLKVPAFVTADCLDQDTGKTLLSVYVPTTPIPTSGYMLLVPEDDVVEIDWDLNETLQAIVSGGISMPDQVRYNRPENIPSPKIVVDKDRKPDEQGNNEKAMDSE